MSFEPSPHALVQHCPCHSSNAPPRGLIPVYTPNTSPEPAPICHPDPPLALHTGPDRLRVLRLGARSHVLYC